MPLIDGSRALGEPLAEHEISHPHRVARKIDPRYVEGEPVRAVGARNQTEAEFIQGLLLEEGIPSMLRRARGFDVPDFLAGGLRDVLVPSSALPAAREVLLESELIDERAAASGAHAGKLTALFLCCTLAVVVTVVLLTFRL